MSRIAVCRLCLATDVNMHNISNSQVQEVFEKLTSKKLPEKGRPDTMCYLCYSQLWKCSRILTLYRKTEDVFDQLSYSGIEITYDTISFLKRRNIVDLLITPVTQIEITTTIIQEHKKTDKKQKVTIKEEPMDEPVEVKLEATELDMECEVVLQGADVIYEESNDSTKDSTWDVTTQKQCLKKERSRKRDNEIRKKVEENIQVKNYPIANAKKSYSCKICDKQFDRKRYLRRHTTQHDTKKICMRRM